LILDQMLNLIGKFQMTQGINRLEIIYHHTDSKIKVDTTNQIRVLWVEVETVQHLSSIIRKLRISKRMSWLAFIWKSHIKLCQSNKSGKKSKGILWTQDSFKLKIILKFIRDIIALDTNKKRANMISEVEIL